MGVGVMLALQEPSFPVKNSSTQQEPIEAQNCPLNFPLRPKLKKSVSHAEVVKRTKWIEEDREGNRVS